MAGSSQDLNELYKQIVRRATEEKLTFEFGPEGPAAKHRILKLKNGPVFREVVVGSRSAHILAAGNFGDWIVLGNYLAIWDRESGIVEIELSGLNVGVATVRELSFLPGFQEYTKPQDQGTLFDFDDEYSDSSIAYLNRDTLGSRARGRNFWKLPLDGEKYGAELSPISEKVAILRNLRSRTTYPQNYLSLKLFGVEFTGHDDALQAVESVLSAFIFEFDICYGIALEAPKFRPERSIENLKLSQTDLPDPGLPRRSYDYEPVSLYSFARSVPTMPLQQFLAYYQVVEHYFPSHWEGEIIRRLRREINHPEFRVDIDAKVNRLIQITKNSLNGRTGGSEKNQLFSVVKNCVEEDDLKEFVNADGARKNALTKRNYLAGVNQISLTESGDSFIKQVCERIYRVRCRIVHAKDDGGGDQAAALLPFTEEANRSRYDVELMQFVSQKCIIASSGGNGWWKSD